MSDTIPSPRTQVLFNTIATSTQADVARWYARGILEGGEIDWPAVNDAIAERWSKSAPDRVKGLAWKLVETRSAYAPPTTNTEQAR